MTSDEVAPLDAIKAIYETLSPRLKKAARYIQRNPSDIALYPLRHVASKAEVSPTTLVRLAADLGYPSYNGFKEAFRLRVKVGAERYAAGASQLIADEVSGGRASYYQATYQSMSEALGQLFASIRCEDVELAAKGLNAARTIYILGMRTMFAPAHTLAYLLRTFKNNVVLLDGAHDMLVDELSTIGAGDILVAISYEPYVRSTVAATAYALERGADVVAITDTPLAPIARDATHVFPLPAPSPSFYLSLLPIHAFVETLASFVVIDAGSDVIERISTEFDRRARFGVYWQEDK